MRLAHGAADGAGRAGARAQRAALALDGVDLVVQQRLAHARRAALVDDVLHIFVAEVAQCGEDGVRGCLAQAAQAVGFDEFGQLCDFVQILHGALAVRDLVQQLQQTLGAHAARRALAAAFVYGEFQEELGNIHHAGVLVHDDEAAGAHHAADGKQVVVVDGCVDETGRDAAAGGAARLRGFEFFAARDAAADLLDDGAQRGAHGNLYKAGILDLAAQREHLGALALLGAHAGEPVRALQDDLRHVGIGLHVVQDGGLAEQALDGRERGTGTRLAALALDGGHQSGLLAAHKGAGAQLDVQVKAEIGAEDIFAQQGLTDIRHTTNNRPYSRAWSMATCRRCTAMGYSARMYT